MTPTALAMSTLAILLAQAGLPEGLTNSSVLPPPSAELIDAPPEAETAHRDRPAVPIVSIGPTVSLIRRTAGVSATGGGLWRYGGRGALGFRIELAGHVVSLGGGSPPIAGSALSAAMHYRHGLERLDATGPFFGTWAGGAIALVCSDDYCLPYPGPVIGGEGGYQFELGPASALSLSGQLQLAPYDLFGSVRLGLSF